MAQTTAQFSSQTLGIPPSIGLDSPSMPDAPTTEADDHALMLQVRDGETKLLGELFQRHSRPLYGFFVRMTNQRTHSEDLVQQVFYRILKYRHSYRDEGNFRTWMYHLARRVAADHFNKVSRSPSLSTEPDECEAVPDHRPHAAQIIEQQDNLALMHRALAQLPVEDREVLLLHRFQHVSHDELAKLNNCTTGAMKVRVHRALQSLRQRFFRLANLPAQGDANS